MWKRWIFEPLVQNQDGKLIFLNLFSHSYRFKVNLARRKNSSNTLTIILKRDLKKSHFMTTQVLVIWMNKAYQCIETIKHWPVFLISNINSKYKEMNYCTQFKKFTCVFHFNEFYSRLVLDSHWNKSQLSAFSMILNVIWEFFSRSYVMVL